ncbi:MAG: HD domain-containing protein [Flavobacteriaceae bacterium]|nr:HD domain-containing protein [Flavobacteriaceae bacterium]
MEPTLINDVKSYVFELLKTRLKPNVLYHTFNHTEHVANAAYEIGIGEGLSEKELEIVVLAAWFHDVGYVVGHQGHEEEGIKIANEFLKTKGVAADVLADITSCILATRLESIPTTKLEMILCDADLSHLGLESFKEKSSLLRKEWEVLCGKELTDIEWLSENERFLASHIYYTDFGFQKYNETKQMNWLKTQNDLQKTIAKKREQEVKLALKEKELQRKLDKDNRPERGIETLYRVTLRNHIKLSDIADTKANILLSVSAIMLSIALTTLFPKLDKPGNAFLIMPTMLFVLTAVVSMVFAILSTRPKVTSNDFSPEDVKNKKVNLLFFGNFHKMPLNEFEEGIKEIIKDRDYLYGSLTKDLYFLGIVLERKYRLLRLTYNVFMFGIIVSVVAFFISFTLMMMNAS